MLKNIIKSLPLIGGLASCNSSDYKNASIDISINFIFSTMPIWLGTYITIALSPNTPISYPVFTSALLSNISNGELFLFATAGLGPIVFIAFGDVEGGNKFPTKISHTIFIIIVLIFSTCSFGLERSNSEINKEFIFSASLTLFAVSWVLLGLATVYKRQSIPPVSEEFKNQEKTFSEDLNRHRRNS